MPKTLTMIGAALALPSAVASAATATATLAVSATVQATCTATADTLGFGSYTPGAGAVTSSAGISVKCTNQTAFTVSLNEGSTASGTIGQRLMANGAGTLEYNLYTSSALTNIWGDGVSGVAQSGIGSGVEPTSKLTVFGRLPDSAANRVAALGNYSDVITVTITY